MAYVVGLIAILVLSSGCVGPVKVRPLVELEHRYSHDLESRVGVYIEGEKHVIDVYNANRYGISNHVGYGVGYWGWGVRWRMK